MLVRRSDLFSATSSPHSSRESSPADDPQLTAFLRARLDEQLGIAIAPDAQPAQPPAAAAAAAENDAGEDDELEFRLFAPTSTATKPAAAAPVRTKSTAQTPSAATPAPAVQKIRLRSPSLDPDRPAGFIAPSRPESYYFAPALSSAPEKQRAEYADAAVAGEEVLRRVSETRWPGCRVPWKVTVVDPVSHKSRSALEGHVGVSAGGGGGEGVGEKKTKRRKSKKARIALRKKKEQGLLRKVAAERQKVEKEEHERAKRAEKNRKQKLKRREKERAKKAAERGEGESEVGKEEDVAMSHG
ncbi:hypothetical protein B0J12DRAFT_737488 [Macrophomina phaseolina]|uniref:Uncharacterized protein n=1 Tax=Macrophomina phaseolina TaxID=35725 RepID=A0ABQ8GKD6_9PEZI|nr:hypothetical protein B0J12DRAFT_737488 [Macrophomina phaseolina]